MELILLIMKDVTGYLYLKSKCVVIITDSSFNVSCILN